MVNNWIMQKRLHAKERNAEKSYDAILALFDFCKENGIKCELEPLYDGYKILFPDGNDFIQHSYSYGSDEGFVEPAIGDEDYDFTAVGLNLAKDLVLKYRDRLETPREKGD